MADTGLDSTDAFIAKWQGVTASELSTSQSFLSDLCGLLLRMKCGMVMAGLVALAGCAESPPEAPDRPAQAGQPINPAETAARMAALRASAVLGDQKGVERQMNAVHSDLMRSMKVPDAGRAIDRESARTAARQVPGVRSVVWVDNTHLLAVVERNELRSYKTIDDICLKLEPLGDTLAVVVNLQSGAARTGDELEVLSRNCQLAPGDNAFMQRKRQIDVIDPEIRRQHRANQSTDARASDDAAMKALLESTPEL